MTQMSPFFDPRLKHVLAALKLANDRGMHGFSGDCGAAAIAINRVLFDGKAEIVAALNMEFASRGRWIGHVAVRLDHPTLGLIYLDADAKVKPADQVENWGMLDAEDPDHIEAAAEAGITWTDEAAEAVTMRVVNEDEIHTHLPTDDLDRLETLLRAAFEDTRLVYTEAVRALQQIDGANSGELINTQAWRVMFFSTDTPFDRITDDVIGAGPSDSSALGVLLTEMPARTVVDGRKYVQAVLVPAYHVVGIDEFDQFKAFICTPGISERDAFAQARKEFLSEGVDLIDCTPDGEGDLSYALYPTYLRVLATLTQDQALAFHDEVNALDDIYCASLRVQALQSLVGGTKKNTAFDACR